jgi:glycine cleavage system H protein
LQGEFLPASRERAEKLGVCSRVTLARMDPSCVLSFFIDHPSSPCLNDRMSKIPSDLKYAKSHEWVRVSGNEATVGITDHAQHELTDVVFVELPEAGKKIKTAEACAVVESVKTASDIYSPVSGEIAQVNKAVVDDPALVNSDPYEAGWFYKIKLSNPSELDGLLTPDQYRAQIGEG